MDFAAVNRRFHDVTKAISGSLTERTITEVLITAAGHAAAITPVATSTLLNSQFRTVVPSIAGWSGVLGYGVNYAEFVHDKPGTLRGKRVQRSPASMGFVWGPNAEPGFLSKGVEKMLRQDVRGIILRNYKI